MKQVVCKGVDIYNPIGDNMPKVIDAYVEVLGEEYRKLITERIANTRILFLFGGGELEVLQNNKLEILDVLFNILELIKEKYNINIGASNESELPKDLLEDELYIYYKKGKKKLEEIDQNMQDFQVEGKDFRYEELLKTLEEEKIRHSKLYTDAFWGDKNLQHMLGSTGALVTILPTEDNKFKRFAFFRSGVELTTSLFAHEIGHIIDSIILKQKYSQYLEKSGFEIVFSGSTYDAEFNDRGKMVKSERVKGAMRKYEAFNEVINDYIGIKVAEVLEAKGVSVGLNKWEKEDTVYSKGFKLLSDFIERNFKLLVKCKMSNDFKFIKKYFGYENYNKLADLLTEYLKVTKNRENIESIPMAQELELQIKEVLTDIENKINHHRTEDIAV